MSSSRPTSDPSTGDGSIGPAGVDGGTPRVAVRALRADLAGMLRRAGAGERLIVTVDGRPIAAVGPVAADASTLDALIAAGQVLAPRRRGSTVLDPQPVWAGVRLDQAFAELRG